MVPCRLGVRLHWSVGAEAWLCGAGVEEREDEEGELTGPRYEEWASRESLRGTHVMWMENDLWSTLCTTSDTDAAPHRRSRATVGGSTPSFAPPPGGVIAPSEPRRRTTGEGGGTGIGGGVGSPGLFVTEQCGVGDVRGTGVGAVAAHAAAVVREHAGVATGLGVQGLDEMEGGSELQVCGGGGGVDVVKATTVRAATQREVSKESTNRNLQVPRQARRSGERVDGEARKAASDVTAGGGMAAWEVGVEEADSVEESPAAMVRPANGVGVLEMSGGEGAVNVQSAGILEGVRSEAGLPEPPTAAEEGGRASGTRVSTGRGLAAPGSLTPRFCADDLAAGGKSVEEPQVVEERVTVESLGEVIELPMMINPLPLMQYYSDAELVAGSEAD